MPDVTLLDPKDVEVAVFGCGIRTQALRESGLWARMPCRGCRCAVARPTSERS